MIGDLRFSRPTAAAATLGDDATDRHRFMDKRLLLTGEAPILATRNGEECLLAALHLGVRICAKVTVAIPPELAALEQACRQVAERVQFRRPVKFDDSPDPEDFDAVLSVGTRAQAHLPWTTVNSDGWLLRVSSGTSNLPASTGTYNPVGAFAAASVGMGEVFKRLVALRPSRGQLVDALAFDLRTYTIADLDADVGDPLEPIIALPDTLIVGVGAIGNGVAYLLSRLRLTGRVTVVDRQCFGDENLGTCVLLGPADLNRPKAEVIAELLNGDGLEAKSFVGEIGAFVAQIAKPPRIAVVGVDSIDARHDTQEFWPDLIIDGAIGTFLAQVGRHSWDEPVGCLRCVFRHPPGRAAELLVSEATGLSVEQARRPEARVTEDDVSAAPAEKQEWLRARIGREICAVAAEVASISSRPQAEGFAPSVPFVATMSGAMVVAELIKAVTGMASPLAPRYQFDLLQGPTRGLHVPQGRREDCKCVTRRKNIDAVRRARLG